jgi:hypothetical protein
MLKTRVREYSPQCQAKVVLEPSQAETYAIHTLECPVNVDSLK